MTFSIKNILIGIAIVILTAFVVVYGIQTFYPSPKYEDFCGKNLWNLDNKEDCISAGGQWLEKAQTEFIDDEGEARPVIKENQCQPPSGCRTKYDKAKEPYSRNVFIISTIIGLILLGLGVYLFELESVGAGIMGGAIIVLIYGSGQYWRYSGDAFRFVVSLIGLILVIFLAYWLNRKK